MIIKSIFHQYSSKSSWIKIFRSFGSITVEYTVAVDIAQSEQAQVDLVKITNRLISNELKINYQNQTYSALEVKVTDTNGTTQSLFQLPSEVYVHVICYVSLELFFLYTLTLKVRYWKIITYFFIYFYNGIQSQWLSNLIWLNVLILNTYQFLNSQLFSSIWPWNWLAGCSIPFPTYIANIDNIIDKN